MMMVYKKLSDIWEPEPETQNMMTNMHGNGKCLLKLYWQIASEDQKKGDYLFVVFKILC